MEIGTYLTQNKQPIVQRKLTIGQPGDKYEQEADAMADKVMRMPQSEGQIQRKCEDCEEESLQMKPLAASITPIVQKQPIEEEEEMLQPKSEGGNVNASASLSSQLSQSKGGGIGLPNATNQHMSNAFSTDFSGVRIHADSNAVQMNRSLGARAFTHGSDVYFNKGEYNPESGKGKRLLAHELTHVVQQGGSNRKTIQRDVIEDNVVTTQPMLTTIGLTRDQVINAITTADSEAIILLQDAENVITNQLDNATNGIAVNAGLETILSEELDLSFNDATQHGLIRQLRGRIQRVRETLESGYLRYMALGIGQVSLVGCSEGDCSGAGAFTCPSNRLMVLCMPFWNDSTFRPVVILHEPFHILFHMTHANTLKRSDANCLESFVIRIGGRNAPRSCVGGA